MKINIDEEILELLEQFNATENSLETLINVLLIEGIEKLVQNSTLEVEKEDKTKILIKILLLKINLLPRVEKMLRNN